MTLDDKIADIKRLITHHEGQSVIFQDAANVSRKMAEDHEAAREMQLDQVKTLNEKLEALMKGDAPAEAAPAAE